MRKKGARKKGGELKNPMIRKVLRGFTELPVKTVISKYPYEHLLESGECVNKAHKAKRLKNNSEKGITLLECGFY